jgi:integrase
MRIRNVQSTATPFRKTTCDWQAKRSDCKEWAGTIFRHTYRTLIDDIGTPLGVQQRLMRHADIKTTMNTYGSAFEKTKRRANSRVADLVLPPVIKSQLKDRAKEVSLKNLRPETATIQ